MILAIILLAQHINSFLLDNNGVPSQQDYLLKSEFYGAKTKLQDAITDLRHDFDGKLAMLTAQLEKAFATTNGTYSANTGSVEASYFQLRENYTQLLARFNSLETEYMKIKTNVDSLAGLKNVQQQLQSHSSASQRVAITGCNTDTSEKQFYQIIKFDDIGSVVGFNGVSNFRSTGKFTAEIDGLYLLAVDISINSHDARVSIYKNGVFLRFVFSQDEQGYYWYSAGGVIAVELSIGDSVWVQPGVPIRIHDKRYACFTVLKIV